MNSRPLTCVLSCQSLTCKTFIMLLCVVALCFVTTVMAANEVDTGFGLDGKVTTNFSGSPDFVIDAVTLPNHDVVVLTADNPYAPVSLSASRVARRYFIVRFSDNGSVDRSFGVNGRVEVGFLRDQSDLIAQDFAEEYLSTVAVQADNKIVIGGSVRNYSYRTGNKAAFAAIRLNADGSTDLSFGNNGTAFIESLQAQTRGMTIQPDGKILLAGAASSRIHGYLQSFALARFNSNGTADVGFGDGGIVLPPASNTRSYSDFSTVTLQADGCIVAAGRCLMSTPSASTSNDFLVARFTQNGLPDTSFAAQGEAIIDFDNRADEAVRVRLQNDGKVVVGGTARTLSGGTIGSPSTARNDDIVFARLEVNGTLDLSFGTNGKTIVDLRLIDILNDFALRDDNRIVAAVLTINRHHDNNLYPAHRDRKLAVLGLTATGARDSGFAINGFAEFHNYSRQAEATRIAALASGRVLVVGSRVNSTTARDIFVVRLMPNGEMENDLGSDGLLGYNLNGGADFATASALLPNGKIIVVGSVANGESGFDFAVARYHADGSLDTSFGNNGGTFYIQGKVAYDFSGGDDFARDVAIQSDGKILIAGTTNTGNFATDGATEYHKNDFALLRLTENGAFDESFGESGKRGRVVFNFNDGADEARSLAVQADGKIILVGSAENPPRPNYGSTRGFAIARFNADGSPDSSFTSTGSQIINISNGFNNPSATSVAIQPDGRIVVGGFGYNPFPTDFDYHDFVVLRLNAAGSPDTSFDTDGITVVNFGFTVDILEDLIVTPAGKIVVGGSSFDTLTFSYPQDLLRRRYYFSFARFNADGTPDKSVSRDGKQLVEVDTRDGLCAALALQPDGKLIAAGKVFSSSFSSFAEPPVTDFALTRLTLNGEVDKTFGTQGFVVTDIAGDDDEATGVLLHPDGKIILTGNSFSADTAADFALVRYRASAPAFRVEDVEVEAAMNKRFIEFVVTLFAPSAQTASINYATADGSGRAGINYVAANGTLVFAPSETAKVVRVELLTATGDKSDKTFTLNLSNAANASIERTQGRATIRTARKARSTMPRPMRR